MNVIVPECTVPSVKFKAADRGGGTSDVMEVVSYNSSVMQALIE